MKTKTYALMFVAFLFALAIGAVAHAQAADSSAGLSADAQNLIQTTAAAFILKHAFLGTVLGLMALARPFAKPLFSLLHTLVDLNPKGEGVWSSLQSFFTTNVVGKTLAWLLDLVLSIKVVPPAKPSA